MESCIDGVRQTPQDILMAGSDWRVDCSLLERKRSVIASGSAPHKAALHILRTSVLEYHMLMLKS